MARADPTEARLISRNPVSGWSRSNSSISAISGPAASTTVPLVFALLVGSYACISLAGSDQMRAPGRRTYVG